MTDGGGVAAVEAPLGKVEVTVGAFREEAWVAADPETVVEVTVGQWEPATVGS